MAKLLMIVSVGLLMAVTSKAQEPVESKVQSFLKHVDEVDRYGENKTSSPLVKDATMRDELGDPDADDTSSTAKLQVKISQLAHEIRKLNGSLDELNHKVSQLEERANKSTSTPVTPATASPLSKPAPAPKSEDSAKGNVVKDVPKSLATLPQAEVASLDEESKLSEQQRYDRAFKLLSESNYDAAEGAFRRFLAAYPKSKLAGNAQYWLGESLYVRSKYADAAASFFEGYKKFPDTSKAPDNLLKLGYSLSALGEKKQACSMLNRLVKQYPQSSESLIGKAKEQIKKLECSKITTP